MCRLFTFASEQTQDEFAYLKEAKAQKRPWESMPIYGIRTYDLQPGKFLEWTAQW